MTIKSDPEGRRPRSALSEDQLDFFRTDEPLIVGFGQGAPGLARSEYRAEVEERPGNRRHRQAAKGSSLDVPRVMYSNFGQ